MNLGDLVHEGGLLFLIWREVWPIVKGLLATESKKAVEARIEKSSAEARSEFVALFEKHPQLSRENPRTKRVARDEFIRRQQLRQHLQPRTYEINGVKEPYKPGDEELMMSVHVSLYKALDGDGKSPEADEAERELRADVLEWFFAELEDEQYDGIVESLHNDQLIQVFLNVLRIVRNTFNALKTRIGSYPAYQALKAFLTPANLARIAQAGLQTAGEVDQEMARILEEAGRNYPWWMVRRDGQDVGKNPIKWILHRLSF